MPERYRVASLALLLALSGVLLGALAPAAAQDLADFERVRALRVLSLLQRTPDAASTGGPAAKVAALATGDGTITGTVSGLDPEGYASAVVMAWPADSLSMDDEGRADVPYAVMRARVEPDGRYRLEGLAPGPYYVSAMAKEYETRYYDDALDMGAASPVDVQEGATVEGIDFALERYNAGAGSIAGTVANAADGHPIADAMVHAFAPENPFRYGSAQTGEDGRYVISGLRSDRYVVEVWSQDYLPEFYGDTSTYEEAVRVEVIEPDQTGGIDFGLSMGGSITGTVRDSHGAPVSGAYLTAIMPYPADSAAWMDGGPDVRPVPAAREGWAVTDDSGQYRMGGLTTGEYRVQAQSSARWYYASVWYDGALSFEQATPVPVTTGQETPGIDLTLDLPVMNSAIAGRVTDANGHPVAKAFVTVQEAVEWIREDSVYVDGGRSPDGTVSVRTRVDGDRDEAGEGSAAAEGTAASGGMVAVGVAPEVTGFMPSRVWAQAATDEDGYYVIEQLPAGTYIVSAAAESGWEYVQRWYVDAASPDQATKVALNEDDRRDGIDIVLPVRVATASISGTVRDQDGHPLAWAFIQISPPEGYAPTSGIEPAGTWAYGQTDSTGAFRVDRLPAGTYVVYATYSTGYIYGHTWYDGADTPQTATPLVLAEGEARTGIDMGLVVRPLYGVVAGTVTDVAGGATSGRAYVELTPVERDVMRGASLWYSARTAVTDESGRFRLDWVPEGIYTLTVYANGASADYVHPDTDALTTPFQVAGGDTITCDVALSMRQDGTGAITGTVTTAYGSPGPLYRGEEPAIDIATAPAADLDGFAPPPYSSGVTPGIAVVVALPAGSPNAPIQYTAVTAPDGTYALRGMAPGDYVLRCFAPDHIGVYYDGAYAPDRAATVHVDGELPTEGIDFELAGMYRYYTMDEDRMEGAAMAPTSDAGAGNSGAAVYGNVADESGQPVEDATVYLLDADEQPVAFAQTNGDGNFELSGVAPGEYRVYAGRPGYSGSFNGNQRSFAAAEPLDIPGGQLQVDLVLYAGGATAVSEEADAVSTVPLVMALRGNYPNPFNPQTRIAFTVPASGRATLRIYNALGQQVAVLFDQMAEAGRGYEIDFQAHELGAGTYFYTLDFEGRRLARPMSLVK
ncbi:MAG: C-terminal target protein [Actinomycetota bacterium]|nr:C-terminal target protein [Actinomycetota bacterium]